MELPREVRTERLLLRHWLPEDRDDFARMNADPRVMEFFPGLMSERLRATMPSGEIVELAAVALAFVLARRVLGATRACCYEPWRGC